MRFGTVDTFLDLGEWGTRMGRPVANESFIRALLQYGNFDSYHFFCPDSIHAEQLPIRLRIHTSKPIACQTALSLSKELQKTEFSQFHLGDFTHFLPFLVGIRDHFSRTPFPITGITHSLDGSGMHPRFLQLLLAHLAPFDGIVCTSRAAQKFVQDKFEEVATAYFDTFNNRKTCQAQTTIIPLGVDDALFDEVSRPEARAHFRFAQDAIVALSVGRLSLRTKTDWSPIFDLLALLKRSGKLPSSFVLAIAGGGTNENIQFLQSQIDRAQLQKTVRLFPNFAPQDKNKLYQAADFYVSVVDNFQETFGINIAEAMASGLAVVASNFSGYRDFVEEGENGFLVDTYFTPNVPSFLADNYSILDPAISRLCLSQMVAWDLEQLGRSILQLCAEPELRQTMGEVSRRKSNIYKWKNIIAQYESFWKSLHAEALKTTSRSIPPLQWMAGHHVQSYLHFPSHLLNESLCVRITDMGREAFAELIQLTRYADLEEAFIPGLDNDILSEALRGPQSIAQLRKRFSHVSNGDLDFHVLWLLKRGALAVNQVG